MTAYLIGYTLGVWAGLAGIALGLWIAHRLAP
jgi:hypothetical protein